MLVYATINFTLMFLSVLIRLIIMFGISLYYNITHVDKLRYLMKTRLFPPPSPVPAPTHTNNKFGRECEGSS